MAVREFNKILTVSIAAYNVEEYIRQALDSLTGEDVVDDLEIFVIDDGGTDRTLEIANEYARKFPNSVFPIHKENGGYGTTVNYGVSHATGKYFKILDGDDWFDADALYQLVSTLKKIDADLVVTPHHKVKHMQKIRKIDFNVKWGEQIRFTELPVNSSLIFPMHSMTYKTQVIRDSNLELPGKCLYTDVIFATVPISKCETIYFLNSSVYLHRVDREGQSVERTSRIKHRQDYEKMALINCAHYERLRMEHAKNLEYLKQRAASACTGAVHSILLAPVNKEHMQELKKFEKSVKDLSKDVFYEEEKIGKTGKLIGLFRKTNYLPYWLLKLVPGGFPCHP